MVKSSLLLVMAAASLASPSSGAVSAPESPAPAIQGHRVTEQNRALLVRSMLTRWAEGDSGALLELLSEDVQWTIAGHSAVAGTTKGKQALVATVLAPFGARFATSSDRFRPREIYAIHADGDTVIAHFRGAGTTNDGHPYENQYAWLLKMKDGKVVGATAFFDSITFDEFWRRSPPADT